MLFSSEPRGGGPSVKFYAKEIPLVRLGQKVLSATEFIDHIQISHPGEASLNCIDRPVTETDKAQYPQQWARYKDGKEQAPEGLPLSLIFPTTPGVVRKLADESIYTVEQLAGLSAHAITGIGMGCQDWVNKATKYLESLDRGAGVRKAIDELRQQVAEIQTAVQALQSDMLKLTTGVQTNAR
jgi:hypothetical protein